MASPNIVDALNETADTPVEDVAGGESVETPDAPENLDAPEVLDSVETVDTEQSPIEDVIDTPPVLSMVDRIAEAGFAPVEGETEEQAFSRLVSGYQQRNQEFQDLSGRQSQLEQLAGYGQQHLANLSQPQAAPAQPVVKEEPKPWWDAPVVDADLVKEYRQNTIDPTTGAQVEGWKDNTPAEVRAGVEQYQAYHQKWANDLTYSPDKVLPPIIEQIATRRFEEMFAERTAAMKQDSFFTRIETDHASELYEIDPITQRPVTDPQTGDYIFSQHGLAVQQSMAQFRDAGVSDPELQWEFANRAVQSSGVQAQFTATAATTTATQAAASKRSQHTRRAAGLVPRGGSNTPADTPGGPPQNIHSSPGHEMVALLNGDSN